MRKRSFFWNILPLYLFVTIISGALLLSFAVDGFKKSYLILTEKLLKEHAITMHNMFCVLDTSTNRNLDSLLEIITKDVNIRYTILDNNGDVLADNKENSHNMDNHRDRPEMIEAYKGHIGKSIRYSETLKRKFMYVAIPVSNLSKNIIIRASVPLLSVNEAIKWYSFRLTIVYIIILLIVLILSIFISRRIVKPLESLTEQASKFAEGNLSRTYKSYYNLETGRLAESMNVMASELDKKINGLTYIQNMQKTVFSSMFEGVVAIDSDEKIILINKAATEILEISNENVIGKYLQEVVRNTKIQRFVNQLMQKNIKMDKDVLLITNNEQDRYIQFHGATLKDENGKGRGAVFVMYDISDLKKMEKLRREFVANVSHELRTPLTTIKGFVETLEDGAINNVDDRNHFLSIINKNVIRLNAIIEDLLTLSKVEKEENLDSIELANISFKKLYSNVMEVCKIRAKEKNISIILRGDGDLNIPCSIQLFEQAIINLIDNAIKYSDNNARIIVTSTSTNTKINVSIKDDGHGIAQIHLPRLFERFYRIDKARSRKIGGTGLGLSIVKHIMNLHNGSISVESIERKGSTFTLTLPNVDDKEENNA